jgi:DNA-binding HxlR family transcriptional regulator
MLFRAYNIYFTVFKNKGQNMLFSILAKKHVKEILYRLNDENEMGFSKLNEEFQLDKSFLSRILRELESENLVSRREERENKRMPKSFYAITENGRKVINLYKLEEEIRETKEKKSKDIPRHYIDNRNNQGFQINGNNIENLHIKK